MGLGRKVRHVVVATLTTPTMVMVGNAPASASAGPQPSGLGAPQERSSELGTDVSQSREIEDLLVQELEGSVLPRTTAVRGGELLTTYQIPGGLSVTIAKPAISKNGGMVSPLVSGGKSTHGVYVLLTPLEQDLIISGGGFALATGICLIPVVGWGLCTTTGAVITAATVFLSNNKRCSGTYPKAKIYPFNDSRSVCSK